MCGGDGRGGAACGGWAPLDLVERSSYLESTACRYICLSSDLLAHEVSWRLPTKLSSGFKSYEWTGKLCFGVLLTKALLAYKASITTFIKPSLPIHLCTSSLVPPSIHAFMYEGLHACFSFSFSPSIQTPTICLYMYEYLFPLSLSPPIHPAMLSLIHAFISSLNRHLLSNYSIPDKWVLMKDTNMSPDLKALSRDRETDMFLE